VFELTVPRPSPPPFPPIRQSSSFIMHFSYDGFSFFFRSFFFGEFWADNLKSTAEKAACPASSGWKILKNHECAEKRGKNAKGLERDGAHACQSCLCVTRVTTDGNKIDRKNPRTHKLPAFFVYMKIEIHAEHSPSSSVSISISARIYLAAIHIPVVSLSSISP